MILEKEGTAFLLVDFQERLAPHIAGAAEIERNLVRLARAANLLRVPLLFTEQYPKGLGPTMEGLRPWMSPEITFEKTSFSCLGEPSFRSKLEAMKVRTLVIAGIEAHICVTQTALEALGLGYRVHIAADAIGSRDRDHVTLARERLAAAGAVISCTEMILFELLRKAGTPEFKEIQALVKDN